MKARKRRVQVGFAIGILEGRLRRGKISASRRSQGADLKWQIDASSLDRESVATIADSVRGSLERVVVPNRERCAQSCERLYEKFNPCTLVSDA